MVFSAQEMQGYLNMRSQKMLSKRSDLTHPHRSLRKRARRLFKLALLPLLCVLSCVAQDKPPSELSADLDQDLQDRVNTIANRQKNITKFNTPDAELWAK